MKGSKLLAIAVLATAPWWAACTDAQMDVRTTANDALARANIENVDVDWDNDGRVVHLQGAVATEAERMRAEQVVSQAVGTNARVANELTVRGANQAMADDLDGGIQDRLDNLVDNDTMLKAREIDFDVNNGVVTIRGTVASADEKTRVAELARGVPGVKDVVNSLDVRASTN